jgi:hypothetical protein
LGFEVRGFSKLPSLEGLGVGYLKTKDKSKKIKVEAWLPES